ncbi:hypothetical protein ACJX0J_020008, partial [Zea mays]
PDHRAHRRPGGRPDCRGLTRHMHEHKRMGGHDLHRPQCRYQCPSLQRAWLRPSEGRVERRHGRRRRGAGDRDSVHGTHPHLQRQLLHHFHQRHHPAASRRQDRRPARPHHGAQQRAARGFRGRGWGRMAGPRRLHQPRLLLYLRPAPGLLARIQVQLWSWGDLVRHALWYHPSDAHLARCGLEDRLESR